MQEAKCDYLVEIHSGSIPLLKDVCLKFKQLLQCTPCHDSTCLQGSGELSLTVVMQSQFVIQGRKPVGVIVMTMVRSHNPTAIEHISNLNIHQSKVQNIVLVNRDESSTICKWDSQKSTGMLRSPISSNLFDY